MGRATTHNKITSVQHHLLYATGRHFTEQYMAKKRNAEEDVSMAVKLLAAGW